MIFIDILIALFANWMWPDKGKTSRKGYSSEGLALWYSMGDHLDKDDLTNHKSDPNDDYFNDNGEGPNW